MEILGIDISVIPTIKLFKVVVILVFACVIASLSLISSNPLIKFIKRALLLFSLLGIIYLNIHSYSSSPYIFLIAEIAVLVLCYKLYFNILTKLVTKQGDVDVASRYMDDIKRKRELR